MAQMETRAQRENQVVTLLPQAWPSTTFLSKETLPKVSFHREISVSVSSLLP